MNNLFFLPVLFFMFYLFLIFGLLYIIYRWVSTFISLKKEHNYLLREILKKMEEKQTPVQ